jgi:hypothetical protein
LSNKTSSFNSSESSNRARIFSDTLVGFSRAKKIIQNASEAEKHVAFTKFMKMSGNRWLKTLE